MLPRFHWSDITTVGHYLGVLILVTGAAMCVPAVVALCFGETRQFGAFLAGIGTCLTLGSSLRFLKNRGLDRRRSLLLVGFGWIVIGLLSSVPLLLSGSFNHWFDALFDSVSALTSTGVTLVRDIDSMSYAQITWRVVMSFSGAQVVIVVALLFGFFGEGSKIQIIDGKRGRQSGQPRIRYSLFAVAGVYTVFAVIGIFVTTFICSTLGFSPIDAFMNGFWIAVTAVGTGSFVPHTSNLIFYHSLPLQLAVSALMIIGALSFGTFVYARLCRFKHITHNAELRVYVAWIVALVVFVVAIMTRDGIFSTLSGFLQNGMMMAISAATTCGMQTVYPEQIGISITDGIVILIILAILLGACAFSTGGGIKFVRILQAIRWIRYSILVRLVPDNARVRIKYQHFGSQDLNSRDATVAMTVLILYLATAALGSMAFIAFGNDAVDSVFEAVSYVSNCGMRTGITQAGLPLPLKAVALLLMWFGRVEFIALIAAVVGIVISLHPENLFSNFRSRNLRTLKSSNFGGSAWRSRKQKGTKDGPKTFVLIVLLVCSISLIPIGARTASAAPGIVQIPAQEIETLSSASEYASTDIKALLSAGTRQDNREVAFTGEAVGNPIAADGQNVWVNVRSNGAMIGVLMDKDQADQIVNYARYEQSGDMLTVYGTYHLACSSHNGELEVHAASVEINELGESWSSSASVWLYAYAAIMIFVGASILLLREVFYGKLRFRRWFTS